MIIPGRRLCTLSSCDAVEFSVFPAPVDAPSSVSPELKGDVEIAAVSRSIYSIDLSMLSDLR